MGDIRTWHAAEQVPDKLAEKTCNSPPDGVGSKSKCESPLQKAIAKEVMTMRRALKSAEAASERLFSLLDS